MKEQVAFWLNRLLVADVFFVLFAFFWFVIALVGHSADIPLGWELWLRLWTPVFNPALGILFLGAFVSWLVDKFSRPSHQDTNP